MGFSFSIDDFLNDFAAGFLFIIGMSITNWGGMKNIFIFLKDNIGDGYILFGLIFVYIIGIIIFGIVYSISHISHAMEEYISTSQNKYLKFIINFIYKLLYFSFRMWGIVGTFNRLNNKNKLPPEISHLKSYNDFAILAHRVREKTSDLSRMYYSKSQFFQTCSDSILLVLMINIILYFNGSYSFQTFPIEYILAICFPTIFIFRILSIVFAGLYFLITARKAVALDLIRGHACAHGTGRTSNNKFVVVRVVRG